MNQRYEERQELGPSWDLGALLMPKLVMRISKWWSTSRHNTHWLHTSYSYGTGCYGLFRLATYFVSLLGLMDTKDSWRKEHEPKLSRLASACWNVGQLLVLYNWGCNHGELDEVPPLSHGRTRSWNVRIGSYRLHKILIPPVQLRIHSLSLRSANWLSN
jgi:hypothetical protein